MQQGQGEVVLHIFSALLKRRIKKVTFLVYICTKHAQCRCKNENIEMKYIGIFLIIFKSFIAEYIFIKK